MKYLIFVLLVAFTFPLSSQVRFKNVERASAKWQMPVSYFKYPRKNVYYGQWMPITQVLDSISFNSVDQTAGSTVGTENVGINTVAPEYTLDVNGVDGIRIPIGTTAQRPLNPETGVIRFNTTRGRFEGFNGVRWVNLSL